MLAPGRGLPTTTSSALVCREGGPGSSGVPIPPPTSRLSHAICSRTWVPSTNRSRRVRTPSRPPSAKTYAWTSGSSPRCSASIAAQRARSPWSETTWHATGPRQGSAPGASLPPSVHPPSYRPSSAGGCGVSRGARASRGTTAEVNVGGSWCLFPGSPWLVGWVCGRGSASRGPLADGAGGSPLGQLYGTLKTRCHDQRGRGVDKI